MKLPLFLILLVCGSLAFAKPIDDILGEELIVSNGWAGESFTFLKELGGLVIVRHKVFGSGVEVVSERDYPVTLKSDYQFKFSIKSEEQVCYFTLRLDANNEVNLFLNGYELKVVN